MKNLSLNQLINLSLATFLLLGIAATTFTVANLTDFSASAAKGGNGGSGGGGKGGGKNGGGSSSAICWVTPNPATLYGDILINGSGFTPNASFGYAMDNSWVGFVVADANGNFSKQSVAPLAGINTIVFSQTNTSCSFTAQ